MVLEGAFPGMMLPANVLVCLSCRQTFILYSLTSLVWWRGLKLTQVP